MTVCAVCVSRTATFGESDGTAVCRPCYVARNPSAAEAMGLTEARRPTESPVRFADYRFSTLNGKCRKSLGFPTARAEGRLKICPKCLYRFSVEAVVCGVCDGPLESIIIYERIPLGRGP